MSRHTVWCHDLVGGMGVATYSWVSRHESCKESYLSVATHFLVLRHGSRHSVSRHNFYCCDMVERLRGRDLKLVSRSDRARLVSRQGRACHDKAGRVTTEHACDKTA